jgi:hypothetical protein
LQKFGIDESVKQSNPPQIMNLLGILFNSNDLIIEATDERLVENRDLIKLWLDKKYATLKEVQSLLGKLHNSLVHVFDKVKQWCQE